MEKTNERSHKTETVIDGTVYIVESVSAESVKDVVYGKVKKLILDHAKLSVSSQAS